MLCEVDRSYIEDGFNLYGLRHHFANFQGCLDIILDRTVADEPQDPVVAQSAFMLYGMIHARFIVTARGLEAMYKKYRLAEFGRCPRTLCKNQPVVPVGIYDEPKKEAVKLYCPRCGDVYNTVSPYGGEPLDGAFFGTSFAHLFFITFDRLVPDPARETYTPLIFGFKIHKSAKCMQRRLPHGSHQSSCHVASGNNGGGGGSAATAATFSSASSSAPAQLGGGRASASAGSGTGAASPGSGATNATAAAAAAASASSSSRKGGDGDLGSHSQSRSGASGWGECGGTDAAGGGVGGGKGAFWVGGAEGSGGSVLSGRDGRGGGAPGSVPGVGDKKRSRNRKGRSRSGGSGSGSRNGTSGGMRGGNGSGSRSSVRDGKDRSRDNDIGGEGGRDKGSPRSKSRTIKNQDSGGSKGKGGGDGSQDSATCGRIPGNGAPAGTTTNGSGGRIARTKSSVGDEGSVGRPPGEYAGDPQQAQQLQQQQGQPSLSPVDPPPANHAGRGMRRNESKRLDIGAENGDDRVASSAASVMAAAGQGQWHGQVASAPCNHVYGPDSVSSITVAGIDALVAQQGSSRRGALDRDGEPAHGPGPGVVLVPSPGLSPRLPARSRTDSGGLATLAAAATISDGSSIVMGGGDVGIGKVAAVEGAGGTMVGTLKGLRGEHSESWGAVGGMSYGGAGGVSQAVISFPRGSNGGPALRAGGDAAESPLLKRSAVLGGGMVESSQDNQSAFLHSEAGRKEDRGACEGAAGKSAAVARGSPPGRYEEVATGDGGSSRDPKRMRTM